MNSKSINYIMWGYFLKNPNETFLEGLNFVQNKYGKIPNLIGLNEMYKDCVLNTDIKVEYKNTYLAKTIYFGYSGENANIVLAIRNKSID